MLSSKQTNLSFFGSFPFIHTHPRTFHVSFSFFFVLSFLLFFFFFFFLSWSADKEKPTFQYCPESQWLVDKDSDHSMLVTWREPLVTDNHRLQVCLCPNHRQNWRKI